MFSTKVSFTATCCDLSNKVKNAALCVMQRVRMLSNNSLEFCTQYGPEVQGLGTAAVNCEKKVHLFALKKFLGVEMRTPNDLVYGETNRYPLFVYSAVRCIRYRLELTRMDVSRLPGKAYRMSWELDARGKRNWVANIRCKLNQFELGYVWLNQGVERINLFLHVLRERAIA